MRFVSGLGLPAIQVRGGQNTDVLAQDIIKRGLTESARAGYVHPHNLALSALIVYRHRSRHRSGTRTIIHTDVETLIRTHVHLKTRRPLTSGFITIFRYSAVRVDLSKDRFCEKKQI